MKLEKLRKVLIALLTCAMVLTNLDLTGTIIAKETDTQTSGEVTQSQPIKEEPVLDEITTETPIDKTDVEQPVVEKQRETQDITNQEDIFSLSLKGVRYQQAEKEEVTLVSEEKEFDLSTMPLVVESLILQFAMTPGNDPLKAEIVKGDTFTIVLPKEYFSVAPTTNPQELKQEEEVIANYTIKDQIIEVTFMKNIDKEAFIKLDTLLEIPVKLNQEVLTNETTKVEIKLQNESITTLLLPKKEEVKKEPVMEPEAVTIDEPDKPIEFTASATMGKEWIDNNDINRPVQKLIDDGGLLIYFDIPGLPGQKLTTDNMGTIGLTSIPTPTIVENPDGNGINHTTYQVTGLPEAVVIDGVEKKITFTLTEDVEKAKDLGYLKTKNPMDSKTAYNIKTTEYSAFIDVKAGDDNPDPTTLPGVTFTLYDDAGNPVTGTPVCVYDADNGMYKYTISDLPLYTLDGKEIIYHLKVNDPDTTNDYYLPEYENKDVPNHGTDITQNYNGGTINLTLTGLTDYTGHKEWLDDGNTAERPKGKLYLWRYTDKGENGYKQASQVRDAANKVITLTLNNTDNTSTFTVGTSSDDYDALPKYDAEGYPYVYLMREVLEDGPYTQVYGKVEENDGTFTTTDTLPDGTATTEKRKDGSDGSLYNTGTLSNLRTGSTTVKTKKTWRAATYQNQLDKVEVTMTLQQRIKGSPEGDWSDVTPKTDETEQTLDGFIAEIMTKEIEASPEKYDELGRELEYQWVETSIKEMNEEGELGDNLLNDDGTFRLNCNSENIDIPSEGETDGKKDVENFISESKPVDEADPSKGTIVTNKLVGTLDYTVDKLWQQADGSYDKIAPTDQGTPKITITVYQNGTAFKEYTMDGTPDEGNKENSSWHLYIDDLPKYDEEGRAYTYVAEETNKEGTNWKAKTSHDVEKRTTTIKNDPVGPGYLIRVQKNWIDDSDVEHRYPVAVNVYKKGDLAKTPINVDGPVILSPENNWWDEVTVKTEDAILTDDGKFDYTAYEMEEVKLQAKDGGTCNTTDATLCEPAIRDGRDVETVQTDQHIYEVTYGIDTEKQMLTVTNRRIGVIDLTVTKEWVDKGNEDKRPDATLTLDAVEDSVTVKENTVEINSSDPNHPLAILNIQDNDGKQTTSTQIVDNTTLSGDDGKKEYYFWNLPKYDKDGKVIHYTVNENKEDNAEDPNSKDYQITINNTAYDVGTTHTNDKQAIEVINQRDGSKNIEYHKKWIDEYRYTGGKRPDIYLTLWKVDSEHDNKPVLVNETGFKNYLWKSKEGLDTAYNWTAAFKDMPMYDDNGQEILYYAQESTNGDASVFDYQEVKYLNSDGIDAKPEDKDIIYDDDVTKGITMLEEDGTFVNGIESAVTIEGKKIWANVDGFPNVKLPEIEIYVDQYYNGTLTKENIAKTKDLTLIPGTNNYTFTITKDNDGNDLPKYNNPSDYSGNGAEFTYQIREEITQEKPAGLSSWDKVFDSTINVFNIENAYTPEKGSLKVVKQFTNIPTDLTDKDKLMTITFDLYRNELDGDGNEVAKKVESKTILHDDFDSNHTKDVTFEGLPITRPDGVKYQYYVVETTTSDAFVPNVTEGTVGTPGTVFKQDVKSNPIELIVDSDDTNAMKQVNFKNNYEPGNVTLTGQKIWDDYGDSQGLRPADNIELKVYRSAPTQPEADNAIDEVEVPSSNYDVTWTHTDTDEWTYTIQGKNNELKEYATNGQEWDYRVEEQVVNGYNNNAVQSVTKKVMADSTITMNDLTNKFKDIQVTKKWEDVGNQYKLRPTSIKVKLQVHTGTGNFEDASTYFTNTLDNGSTAYAFERELTNDSEWQETFTNLPYVNKDGNNLIYRVIETAVGDDNTVWDDTDGYVTESPLNHHNYLPTGDTDGIAMTGETTLKTTITNTLTPGMDSLIVAKIWEDSEDIYDSRPLNEDGKWTVTFALERKLSSDTDWQPVYETGTKTQVMLTLTGDKGKNESNEFENLPRFEVGEMGVYEYRAKEVLPLGYIEPVYVYPVEGTTEVTNKLDAMSVSVNKQWETDTIVSEHPSVTFELQYSTDGIKWNSFNKKAEVTLDGTTDSTGETSAWTATWSGLPKYKNVSGEKKDMQYRAVEAEVPSGYWKDNNGISESITIDNGTSTITNTPTAFSLNKVNEENVAINDVELTIYKANDTSKPLVTWTKDTSDNITITPDSTNAPSVVIENNVIYGLPQGNYILKETKTPDVYATAKDIPFTIKADGTLSSTTTDAINGNVADGIMLTMKDRLAYGQVELSKTVSGGTGDVNGIMFDLYKADDTLVAKDITTDDNGKWTSVGSTITREDNAKELSAGLEVGSYYFLETKASNNTQLDDTTKHEFTITNENDYVNSNKKVAVNIENAPYVGSITLTKTGENSTSLEGVTFDLYQDGTTNPIRTDLTTNEDGKIIVEDLSEKGTYYFQETKAADGYKLDVTISEKVTLSDKATTATIDMTNEKTKFYLDKVDVDDTTIKVNDVELTIYKEGDTTFTTPLVTWARDSEGTITVTPTGAAPTVNKTTNEIIGLPAGSYVLKETKLPEAYAQADDISFKVAENGELSSTSDAVSQVPEGYVVTMKDRLAYAQVALTKTITDGKEGDVNGVVFNLYRSDESVVANGITTDANGKWTSTNSEIQQYDKDGTLTDKKLKDGLAVGSYYFLETKASNNTQLDDTTKHEFTITNENDYVNSNKKVAVNIENAPYVGSITLTKTGENSTSLEGVTFDLYQDGTTNPIRTDLTTNEDGKIIVDDLSEKGTYYFQETKAADGYKLDVTISEKVTLSDTTTTAMIDMTNEKTKFYLDKVDVDDTTIKVNDVELTIYKEGDTTFTTPLVTWARDSEGTITVTPTGAAPTVNKTTNEIIGLPAGSYVLKETKLPEAYAQADDISFKVAENGELSSTSDAVSQVPEGYVVTMKDRLAYAQVALTKTITDGKEGDVNGVVFNLYRSDESLVANDIITDDNGKWTSTDSEILQYDKDGTLTDKKLKDGLAVGSYYFKEVSTTNNTFLNDTKWTFEIKNTDDFDKTKRSVSVNVTNDAYESKVILTKKGDQGTLLEGVKFDLYKKGETTSTQTYTTDKDGVICIEGLSKGDYYLKEVATLDNYLLDDTTMYEFTLDETNTSVTPITMEAMNTLFESYLELKKIDSTDGGVISNTEFTLYKKDGTGNFVSTNTTETSDDEGLVKFTIHEKGTYKIVESKASDGYEFDESNPYETSEYVIDNTSTFQKATHTFDDVENTRKTGTVELRKIDGDDQSKLDGVVFSLYRKDNDKPIYLGDFTTGNAYTTGDLVLRDTSTWNRDVVGEGILRLNGMPWGAYYFQEKTGLDGYGIADTQYEFTIGKDGQTMKLSEDLGTIENHKTQLTFNKMGLYVEECSDTTLGSESPDSKLPLSDVEFTIYDDMDATNEIMKATSDSDGKVMYVGVPIGTYYMKETSTPQGYVPNDILYQVTVDKEGSITLEDSNHEELSEIINDVYRSDITIKKVSKADPDKVLANSLYGLYRRSFTATSDLQLVATARTDASGSLTFKGVLMNEDYAVQELESPDGSQVSENPIWMSFHVENGTVKLDTFDDGEGTAYLDGNGQIVWKEPQVMVNFEKKDEKGNLLAGATLQVEDEDGKVVVQPWVTNKEKGDMSVGELVAGKTYRLVEVKAPIGYLMSDDVTFTVDEVKVSPDEDHIQYVEMIDKLEPVVPTTSTNTGDTTDFGGLVMLQIVSITALFGVFASKRKKKQCK